jgi:transposase
LVDPAAALREILRSLDYLGLLFGFILTGGEAYDYTVVMLLVKNPAVAPKSLLADMGYDGDHERERVERMLDKLVPQRRIATGYNETNLSFESFLNPAAACLWLKSCVNRPNHSPRKAGGHVKL